MRVIWVTPAFPDLQGSGGQVHEFELLRAIASRHEITVLSTFGDIRPGSVDAVRQLGIRTQFVEWDWRAADVPRPKISKLVRLLLGSGPTVVASNRSGRLKPLREAVAAEEEARPADIVQIIQGDLAPIVDAARAPTALLLFDIYSRVADLVLQGGNTPLPRLIRYRLERRNARRFERHWYRRADGVACVSPVDAEIARGIVGHPVEMIPNPVPQEFFESPTVPRSRTRVTFVGSFGWEPNIDSVEWLCREIWPEVLRRRPDARMRIVGRFASPELQATVAAAGGDLLTDVEDIRPAYWDAAVMIAPIRMGSGTRNKILHAMACGAPLVATPSALEGIPARGGEHLLVADDAAGLADAVVAILDDPGAAATRVEAARPIPLLYAAEAAGKQLEAWWAKAIAAAATRRPASPKTPSSDAVGGPGR